MREIIEKAQTGDSLAFQSLVEAHQMFAFRVAFRLLCHEENAHDVVQEAFIRVWKHLEKFNNRKRFSTWLYKIIVNLCYDQMKSAWHQHHQSINDDCARFAEQTDLEGNVSNQDLIQRIRYFSRNLPPLQKAVFILRDLEELSIDEIADIVNISKGSVKSNLYYARSHIRNKMKALL